MCLFLAPAGQPEMIHKNFMHQHLRIFVVQRSCLKFYAPIDNRCLFTPRQRFLSLFDFLEAAVEPELQGQAFGAVELGGEGEGQRITAVPGKIICPAGGYIEIGDSAAVTQL